MTDEVRRMIAEADELRAEARKRQQRHQRQDKVIRTAGDLPFLIIFLFTAVSLLLHG